MADFREENAKNVRSLPLKWAFLKVTLVQKPIQTPHRHGILQQKGTKHTKMGHKDHFCVILGILTIFGCFLCPTYGPWVLVPTSGARDGASEPDGGKKLREKKLWENLGIFP